MIQEKKKITRSLSGQVVSDKSDKTIIVRVDTIKTHPVYHKKFTISKKFKVHDPKNQYKEGDLVVFEECRPLSKDKRWRVIKKVK